MTEEDTFNKLKKPTYREMKSIWANSDEYKEACKLDKMHDEAKIDELFQRYGWTVYEYTNCSERFKS